MAESCSLVSMSEVTLILNALQQGDPKAADQLLPVVYSELRKLAAHKMSSETPGQTLQPTALVHEAWLRLVGEDSQAQFQSRAHFFGAAAEAMRRILIERARRKQALRHGGGQQRIDMDEIDISAPGNDEQLLAVNDALERLCAIDAQKAELVKLRYFVGMTLDEAALVLGISKATAKRWWAYSRAWLFGEIKSQGI